jgi:hypothetical protein
VWIETFSVWKCRVSTLTEKETITFLVQLLDAYKIQHGSILWNMCKETQTNRVGFSMFLFWKIIIILIIKQIFSLQEYTLEEFKNLRRIQKFRGIYSWLQRTWKKISIYSIIMSFTSQKKKTQVVWTIITFTETIW